MKFMVRDFCHRITDSLEPPPPLTDQVRHLGRKFFVDVPLTTKDPPSPVQPNTTIAIGFGMQTTQKSHLVNVSISTVDCVLKETRQKIFHPPHRRLNGRIPPELLFKNTALAR